MATATTHARPWPTGTARPATTASRTLTAALWVVTIPTAAMFIMAGWPKFAGAPLMVQTFDAIGMGQWFRYLTGAIEMASAVALLVPSVALYGAVALAVTMVGAVATHVFLLGGSPAVAATLLVATSVIAWARWSRR